MKFFIIAFLVSAFSYASNIPLPTYLPPLKGVLLKNIVDRSDFEFTPGSLKKCERTELTNEVFYDCSLIDCSVKVIDGEKTYDFSFERVHISFYALKPGVKAGYLFIGNWSINEKSLSLSSRAVLELHTLNKTYEDVRGALHLQDYNLKTPIQAYMVK